MDEATFWLAEKQLVNSVRQTCYDFGQKSYRIESLL
jgi:hypothetical protein